MLCDDYLSHLSSFSADFFVLELLMIHIHTYSVMLASGLGLVGDVEIVLFLVSSLSFDCR